MSGSLKPDFRCKFASHSMPNFRGHRHLDRSIRACKNWRAKLNQRHSQGGAEFPTGGKRKILQARERLLSGRVKQIRCKSWADGYSPDERECACDPPTAGRLRVIALGEVSL
jgi:hypothetical protein